MVQPVETVAASVRPEPEPIRPVTKPDQRPKSVTGRKDLTVLKTKPLLKVVPNPSRDEKPKSVTGRKPKPDEPSRDELDHFKRLLPPLPDGRWTVENEGYGWKVRKVWDHDGTTSSKRWFGIRWATWRKLKGTYDDNRIRAILAEKVRSKDANAGPVRHLNAG